MKLIDLFPYIKGLWNVSNRMVRDTYQQKWKNVHKFPKWNEPNKTGMKWHLIFFATQKFIQVHDILYDKFIRKYLMIAQYMM